MLFFPPVNFNKKDGIIVKSTQIRKILCLIVNILRNTVLILSTWNLRLREQDSKGMRWLFSSGLRLLTTAAAVCNWVLDLASCDFRCVSIGFVWRGLFGACGFLIGLTIIVFTNTFHWGFEGARIQFCRDLWWTLDPQLSSSQLALVELFLCQGLAAITHGFDPRGT